MSNKRLFVIITLSLALLGTAQAAGSPVNMVNPIEMVADVDTKLRGTNLYQAIMTLATSIAVIGFFVKLYAAVGKNIMSEIRGTIVQGIGVALMLSLASPIHGALTTSWNNTYNTSNAAFAGALEPKIQEAQHQMNHIVLTVGTVATLGTTAAAAGGAISATAAGETAASGAIDAAGSMAGKAAARISSASMALSGFFIMYSGIIAISAFVIMMVGYVIPLVIAFTMWGQTGPIWTAVGSSLGSIIVAAMMPMLAYSAIDLTFVQSANASAAAMDNSWLVQTLQQNNASLAPDQLSSELTRQARDCANKQASDPTTVCIGDDTRALIQKAYDTVKGVFSQATNLFNNAIIQVVKFIGSSILQVIFSVLYFIIALTIMGAIVNFLIGVLGGAASYVGAVAKGGG